MWPRRIAFLAVIIPVFWYVTHFTLNALMLATDFDLPAPWGRLSDLALVPVCAAVAWWLLRRLERKTPS